MQDNSHLTISQRIELLDSIIQAFIVANYPIWEAFLKENQFIKATRRDKEFATVKDKNSTMRWSATFPVDKKGNDLLGVLLEYEPQLLKNKRLWNAFRNKHPEFWVSEK